MSEDERLAKLEGKFSTVEARLDDLKDSQQRKWEKHDSDNIRRDDRMIALGDRLAGLLAQLTERVSKMDREWENFKGQMQGLARTPIIITALLALFSLVSVGIAFWKS